MVSRAFQNARALTARDTQDRLINGSFQVWQRGTSSSAATGYHTVDRWQHQVNTGTLTVSQQAIPLGTKFGRSNLNYACRLEVSGQSVAGAFGLITQRIEGVETYSGETITVLGWARRIAGSGNMAVGANQRFGTGGSPSAGVDLSGTQVTLTANWEPFAVQFDVPSVSGKTLGTNNDDFLGIDLWASAGTDFNVRADSLGTQTITVEFAGVHILPGVYDVSATENYLAPDFHSEFDKCQRYFLTSYPYGSPLGPQL